MAVIYWWLLFVWPVIIGGAWYARRRWQRAHPTAHRGETPLAHTGYLTGLPVYQAAQRRYLLLLRITTGCAVLAVTCSLLLTARPASATIEAQAQHNRDIMLCLDVSGSMMPVDSQIVDRFSTLVHDFAGQRIGLVIFNSSPQSIIPLTDDYDLIESQLQLTKKAIVDQQAHGTSTFLDGTYAGDSRGASLASDGLASCIQHMGANTAHRSQSVIFATDNEAEGTPIITFEQAMGMAKQRSVRVYALDPGPSAESYGAATDEHAKLKSYSEQTGGSYFLLKNGLAIPTIINKISSQEATYFAGTPQLAVNDNPKLFMLLAAGLTAAVLALSWRLRL